MPKQKTKPAAVKKRIVFGKQLVAKVSRPAKSAKSSKSSALLRKNGDLFPIVGIGASAGGLEAMTRLLDHLPPQTGMAFVLVQHLDPTHESALATLLARSTQMPVGEARHNTRLEPDTLYVIPPNKVLGIAERRLKLSPRKDSKEHHNPIDHFLRLLAGERQRAIGVILSGNGSDGTQGLLVIKGAGGITFAQDEKSSKYPAMPGSAVASGCVDFVLSPEKIGRELARLVGHPLIAPSKEELARGPVADGKPFDEVMVIMRQRMGVDFAHYKHATLRAAHPAAHGAAQVRVAQ